MRPIPGKTAFWNRPLIELEHELGARTGGLTEDQAKRRLDECGPNQVRERPARPLLIQFLSRFKSPLVLLLGASLVTPLPLSSIFDFLTFYLMKVPFRAGETAFHTGWFIESIATQVLVVFVIRTRGNPFKSRCSAWLAASSLSAVLLAVIVPFTPIAGMLGFAPCRRRLSPCCR